MDLVVDVGAARAAEAAVRAVQQRCGPASRDLHEAAVCVTGADLGLAAQELQAWADEVAALCARVVEQSSAARRACEALAAVDGKLGR